MSASSKISALRSFQPTLAFLPQSTPLEYYSRYEESLTLISDALNGYMEFDPEVTTDIFENDLAQTDNIFNSFSSGDIKDNCKRRVQARDLFGDDLPPPLPQVLSGAWFLKNAHIPNNLAGASAPKNEYPQPHQR
jgi:hypothetical protein